MEIVPTPRFDLIDHRRYASMSVQYSRGCPFQCEFCDIIEVFGRKPRTKTPAQILGELDSLRATGYRGSVFVVDDNFIGNRVAVAAMLPHLMRWQREHGFPFELYTEADQLRCLRNAGARLTDGGSLVLELFVPEPVEGGSILAVDEVRPDRVTLVASRHGRLRHS